MDVLRSTRRAAVAVLSLILFFLAVGSRAQSLDGAWGPPEPSVKEAVRPLHLERALSAAPLHVLRSAEEDARGELDALIAWNAAHKRPVKNGFARPLPRPLAVRLTPSLVRGAAIPFAGGFLAESEPGRLTWGTHVRIAGAYRVRLHLTDVHLPAGTRLAVSTPGGAPQRFGLELLSPEGDLWTPSARGEALELEVEVPVAVSGSRPFGFDVREALEIVSLDPRSSGMLKADTSCIEDATCKGNGDLRNIATYARAVAQLQFVVPHQGAFLCTGTLLNDQAQDSTPYLLTANHCIGNQGIASSLEAFFDYDTATCGGFSPLERDLPHSNGATLLATESAARSSDFSFLRLASLPGGRYFLGWNADSRALRDGTPLFRLSHPAPDGFPLALSYTQYANDPAFEPCDGITAPQFLYSHTVTGATAGGSSGSALLLASGQVVGQLGGACGVNPDDICSPDNDDFDGAFAVTYPNVQQWLGSPAAPGTTTVSGAISAIQSKTRFISLPVGTTTLSISVPTSARITLRNRVVAFTTLKVGTKVTVTYKVVKRVNVAQLVVITPP